ncbi:hypothetical protein [Streptomyces sp. TLI_146]|uniref:hypothetical protein n=1 Tax=Streptomyces sp. TLI_146 TaxID=1938858 RepID=UPI00117F1C01|nr:hypothetical protein [Streptomyces sp. TLI_146]
MSRKRPVFTVPEVRFTAPEVQLRQFHLWNHREGLGFSKAQIATVEPAIPPAPASPLVVRVLCWTLDNLSSSLDAKLKLICEVYGDDRTDISDSFKTGPDHLWQVDGAPAFQPHRLWWEIIDLGSVRDTAPDQVDPEIAAGLQVFDLASQCPDYLKRHNGRDIPYLDVPGLYLKGLDKSRLYVPYFEGSSDRSVYVNTGWADDAYSDTAQAVVVREG